jgi:hypothetical protein
MITGGSRCGGADLDAELTLAEAGAQMLRDGGVARATYDATVGSLQHGIAALEGRGRGQ